MNYARGCWNAASTQMHKETCSGSAQTTRCHLTREPNQSPLHAGEGKGAVDPRAVGCRGGEGRLLARRCCDAALDGAVF